MSKKVFVLSGSPRKNGNSDLLCDQFVKGVREANHDVTKVFLVDREIHYCVACDGCRRHHGQCVIKDDMAKILEQMIQADVIVLASPVYFYSMNAQMKTLIDRTVARYTEIRNKEFYFIVTAADGSKSSLHRTIEGFRGFIDCLPGAKEKGVIYGTGVWQKGDVLNSSLMKEAYELGLHS